MLFLATLKLQRALVAFDLSVNLIGQLLLQYHTLISSSLTALGVRTPDSVISADTSAGG